MPTAKPDRALTFSVPSRPAVPLTVMLSLVAVGAAKAKFNVEAGSVVRLPVIVITVEPPGVIVPPTELTLPVKCRGPVSVPPASVTPPASVPVPESVAPALTAMALETLPSRLSWPLLTLIVPVPERLLEIVLVAVLL